MSRRLERARRGRRARFSRRDHRQRELDRRLGVREAPICPHCQRVMSHREAIEQGACNDCNGGAWSPEAP